MVHCGCPGRLWDARRGEGLGNSRGEAAMVGHAHGWVGRNAQSCLGGVGAGRFGSVASRDEPSPPMGGSLHSAEVEARLALDLGKMVHWVAPDRASSSPLQVDECSTRPEPWLIGGSVREGMTAPAQTTAPPAGARSWPLLRRQQQLPAHSLAGLGVEGTFFSSATALAETLDNRASSTTSVRVRDRNELFQSQLITALCCGLCKHSCTPLKFLA